MMLGEPRHATLLQTQLLQWPPLPDSPRHYHCSSPINNTTTSLHRYLLLHSPDTTNLEPDQDDKEDDDEDDLDLNLNEEDAYACDDFRMYEFKVRRCPRGRSHDWTECPFAHPGEKARRRDPRRHRYSGTACPDFRRGSCRKGDSCELSHGVFECWLHPSRYRTQPCKDGINCRRRVCFFAHTPQQLRLPPLDAPPSPPSSSPLGSYDGSPLRRSGKMMPFSTSSSPPASPSSALSSAMRRLQLGWVTASTKALVDFEEEREFDGVVLERVESGRGLRARIAEKLSRENPLEGNIASPDVDWISDLLN